MRFLAPLAYALALAVLVSPVTALASETSPPRVMVPFSGAPAPVQRGLVRLLAGCDQTPAQVRQAARFVAGPLAGPGGNAYLFAMTEAHWRAPMKYVSMDGVCGSPVQSWFEIWMPVGVAATRASTCRTAISCTRARPLRS